MPLSAWDWGGCLCVGGRCQLGSWSCRVVPPPQLRKRSRMERWAGQVRGTVGAALWEGRETLEGLPTVSEGPLPGRQPLGLGGG